MGKNTDSDLFILVPRADLKFTNLRFIGGQTDPGFDIASSDEGARFLGELHGHNIDAAIYDVGTLPKPEKEL